MCYAGVPDDTVKERLIEVSNPEKRFSLTSASAAELAAIENRG